MSFVMPIDCIVTENRAATGGKALALARLAQSGLQVPAGVCITVDAYHAYVSETGIRDRVGLELKRKAFSDMRWEEMWDAALRIRSMFLNTPLPAALADTLTADLEPAFSSTPVCVRSSSLAEDSCAASFAGLHESFVNIIGVPSILEHVRLVWASLWSDAALLYRQELGLSIANSAMAVVVQELVVGDASGIGFSEHPENRLAAVVEAVYGLNEGLVGGTIEPDRWILDRVSGEVIEHHQPRRCLKLQTVHNGVRQQALSRHEQGQAPLDQKRLDTVYRMLIETEKLFGVPQDTEWTWLDTDFYLLQARPLTTRAEPVDSDDQRPWYLSLRGSLDSLVVLQERIEGELLPAMTAAADACPDIAPETTLTDAELAGLLEKRVELYQKWKKVYWDDFIPFAHGMRLFGQVYNDCVRPEDPYEFMDLLVNVPLLSVKRNQALRTLGKLLLDAENMPPESALLQSAEVEEMISRCLHEFGGVDDGEMTLKLDRDAVCLLAKRLAGAHDHPEKSARAGLLEAKFRSHCGHLSADRVETRIAVARASYRLRDDDNLYLGRIEAAMLQCAQVAGERLRQRKGIEDLESLTPSARVQALRGQPFERKTSKGPEDPKARPRFVQHSRQITGQPAGAGVAHGVARVIASQADLLEFSQGEILVCDSIQPHMTIIAPLAKAVVERRGGMLIHGAIIAREYGLPCVTGVRNVTSEVKTGEHITVDGYLGIVVNHGSSDYQLLPACMESSGAAS